jgi:hypothetical protein
MRRKLAYAAAGVVVLAAILQFVQPERTNPPSDPAASFAPPPHVASVIERSCKDCHSNRTTWPWYSGIAPVSWLVVQDVKEGRARLNLSEWARYAPDMAALRMKAMCQQAATGEMPPWQYRLVHRNAKLGQEGVAALCAFKP